MTPYLLVLWMASYQFNSTVTMQRLDSKEQCEAVGKHIGDESRTLRSWECIPLEHGHD